MKKYLLLTAILLMSFMIFSSRLYAQNKTYSVNNQKLLLESKDPHLASNKKLVYDFWRIVFEGGHLDEADKFMKETYIQHNPNVKTGRQAFIDFFSQFTKPKEITDTIQADLFAIVAEGDLVTLCFYTEYPEPDDSTKSYHTTWFDMFRIEDGKIAEHWDAMKKL